MALHLGYVTRETAVSLKRNLLMTRAGILTVAVSLFLFGGVLLLSRMVDHGTARWKNGVELEIFLCSKSTAEPDSPKPACRAEASEGMILNGDERKLQVVLQNLIPHALQPAQDAGEVVV